MYSKGNRFPWQYWVRLVYNDAIAGQVNAGWRFRKVASHPLNKPMQAYAVQLENMKSQESVPFDKLSQADYAVAAAYSMIQEAGGPVMLDEFAWGRKDAQSVSECGNHHELPKD